MQNIHFDEWTSTQKEAVENLFNKLSSDSDSEFIENGHLDKILLNLKTSQIVLSDLCELIEKYEFETEKEEITFFKYIKPQFSCSLIYWEKLMQLHLQKPVGGENMLRKYYKRNLKNLKLFYNLHSGLYEYLRGNFDYLDNLHFLRSSLKLKVSANSVDLNPKFTTAKDRLVGEIYANDLLEQYIQRQLNFPTGLSVNPDKEFPSLRWTSSRAGLVELIYALQSGGVYNDGQISIRELADTFGQLFKVDLGNYYHVFNEIRLRKKNRTSLLDHLKERIIRKMDTMDEK